MSKGCIRRETIRQSLWQQAAEVQALLADRETHQGQLEQAFGHRLHDGKSWVGSAKRLLEGSRSGEALACLDALADWMDTGRPGLGKGLRNRLARMMPTWQSHLESSAILTIRVSPAVPDNFEHVDLVISALDNLLRNSLNFTKRGGIRAQIWRQRSGISLTVCDTGSGINPDAPSVGWGLGLTFLRSEIQRAQGSISIQSKANTGTQVRVHLPMQESPVLTHR